MADFKKQKSVHYPAPRDGIDWQSLGFCLATRETKMVVATCKADGIWSAVEAKPYGPLALEPSATILNYGQGVFEGMKAYRTDKGRIVIFRPQANGARMAQGAERMMMPVIPESLFLQAVGLIVRENADWVPPGDQGAFYMRPLLFGSGAELGVKPSPEYTFIIYASPVSSYFSGGARMRFIREHHRAAPLGVGTCKAPGNYAPCMVHQKAAKAAGFSDVIYLDTTGENIEEVAASNFFCVKDGTLFTPELGTILPGITRDSVLRIARDVGGLEVFEGKVGLKEAFSASEAFCTGTGAGIAPIEHIANGEDAKDLAMPGPVTTMLSRLLDNIRLERCDDKYQWLYDPFAE